MARDQYGQTNNSVNHSYFGIIFCCSNCRDWWGISYLVMDKEKENINSGFSWGSSPIYLWDNSNTTTFKLWKGLCNIWWNIRSFLYPMGSVDRQKEARQI